MPSERRYNIRELTAKEYCLYRVICGELYDLQREINCEESLGRDLVSLSTAMEDRRLLVEWLRELRLPPASLYCDCNLTEAVEDELLKDSS